MRHGNLWAYVPFEWDHTKFSGIIKVGRAVKIWILGFLLFSQLALGQNFIPDNAKKYAPLLKKELINKWPEITPKNVFAGQIEQETCISLKHKGCWSPTVELKTSREYGFGIGQLTLAYNKDGSERFNAFNDVKKLDKDLASWKWENRFDPSFQMRAMVIYDKSLYSKIPNDVKEKLPFMFAMYNGGAGGILQDRRLCISTSGCNPNLWFGNVAKTSFKSKIKPKGYGQSFFDTNRGYPENIIHIRAPKYTNLMNE